jgi:RIO-like serine/threonine protein kinase
MAKIRSFNIKKGSKIGGYKIQKVLGRGWESEVYECIERTTGAKRAIKLFSVDKRDEVGYVMHYAWFLEKLSNIGITPRYFHMGMEFNYEICRFGFAYIVQEFIKINEDLSVDQVSEEVVLDFRDKLKSIHNLGYALGDWNSKNQCIDSKNHIRKIDFDPGRENKPNKKFKEDINWFNKTFKKIGVTY